MSFDETERAEIRSAFADAINMSPAAHDKWLDTPEAKSVGDRGPDGEGESTGHRSGKLILAIRRKKVAALTHADYAHMAKTVGFIHRHLAQKPSTNLEHSRWRYSLMNWGHDPLTD
jgi:hypothetical protein